MTASPSLAAADPGPPADPDRALMLLHAPRATRPALAALIALDEALAGVLRSTSEPMIGMMRLAWWRESLQATDDAPRAQPVLRSVACSLPGRGAALAGLVDGWEALFESPITARDMADHGNARGAGLFAAAADVLAPGGAAGPVRAAGAGWALVDLAFHMRDRAGAEAALAMAGRRLAEAPVRWPAALRPLGALTALARHDLVRGLDRPRHLGGPGRALRMLRVRITGRG